MKIETQIRPPRFHEFQTKDRSRGYTTYSAIHVDVSRVVVVEKGEWDNQQQDWHATLVLDDGSKCETATWRKDIVAILEGARAAREPQPAPVRDEQHAVCKGEFDDFSISEVARRILIDTGYPMSAMDIARAARSRGWNHDDEGGRSRIAAIVAKDAAKGSRLFKHVARGQIALSEWGDTPPEPSEQGGGGEQASEREPDAMAVRLANKTVNEWIGDSPSAVMSGNAECKLRAGVAAAIDAALAEQRDKLIAALTYERDETDDASVIQGLDKAISIASILAAPEEQRRVLGREREKA